MTAAERMRPVRTPSDSPFPVRIQSYLRAVAPLGRDSVQVGPFLATFTPGDDNPYLNYAIPADRAEPTGGEIEALIGEYTRRGRRARLEYVTALAPAVEGRLVAAGFRSEGRLTLMVFGGGQTAPTALPRDVTVAPPETDEDLYAMAAVQAEAYGDELPDLSVVERRRQGLARGAIAMVARDAQDGIVGAGSCSVVHDALSEIAGIGVAVTHRRRGIGAALASGLARSAVAAGAEVPWLMAVHDG